MIFIYNDGENTESAELLLSHIYNIVSQLSQYLSSLFRFQRKFMMTPHTV